VKTFLGRNWFVLALPWVIGLAWLIPEAGATGGWLRSEVTTRWGVMLIFVMQGLALPMSALRQGAARWRLHGLVKGVTFGVFPLLGWWMDACFGAWMPGDLRTGFLFLCALPSTISSSVVLTGMAGGNTAGAIFNAALSNLAGVVVTPLWVAWWMRAGRGEVAAPAAVFGEIAWLMLLPMGVGQLMRRGWAGWADRHKRVLGHVSGGLILFLVFAAFCNSVRARFWVGLETPMLLGAAGAVGLILGGVMLGVAMASRWLGLGRGDRIAALFCAPQKTVASGIPLAKALFGTHPGLGLIVLPLLLYHPLQLIVCGFLADRWSRRATPGDGKGD
jgi:sodium/bile acid cotransporter 7